MAWVETSGSRRVIKNTTNKPHHIDYIIAFQAVTATTPPVPGVLYGDATLVGSGTLPSTGLVAEPEVIQVSALKKLTKLDAQIVVRFRGWYSQS